MPNKGKMHSPQKGIVCRVEVWKTNKYTMLIICSNNLSPHTQTYTRTDMVNGDSDTNTTQAGKRDKARI